MAMGLAAGLCYAVTTQTAWGVEFGAFSVVAKDHRRGAAAVVA
jgi:hypothetical protein